MYTAEEKALRGKRFSYRKLKGRIVEQFGTQGAFAKEMGIPPQRLSSRLSGKTNFNPGEIVCISYLLEIPKDEIGAFFFTLAEEDDAS